MTQLLGTDPTHFMRLCNSYTLLLLADSFLNFDYG